MKTIPIISIKQFAPKQLQGKYCLSPFKSIAIDPRGNIGLCLCIAWMPQPIGNILEHTLEDCLSSPLAQKIRQSITNGTFEFCNELNCGVIQNNELIDFKNLSEHDRTLVSDPDAYEMPTDIFLSMDTTCNLSCPSCRTSVISPTDEQIDLQHKIGETLYNNLFSTPTDKHISLRLSSSGEVFASRMLLNFLEKINTQDFPNIEIWLQTNGLLAQSRWKHLQHLEQNIEQITITVDASTESTYEKLRRGGKWPDLLNSLEFLKSKKELLGFKLETRMVVQLDNFREIGDFYKFSKKFNVDTVDYTRILDWGVFSPEEFAEIDVFDRRHPLFNEAKNILDSVLTYPDIRVSGGL